MKKRNYKKIIELTTRKISDNASLLIIIRDFGHLIQNTKNKALLNNIYTKLMTMFFQNNNLAKKYILKVLKANKKKLVANDPLVFKTEILNNLLSNDFDCAKYILKYIQMFKDKFIDDYEIVTEVRFLRQKNNVFAYKNELKNVNYKDMSLEEIVHYVENNKDKYTVKFIIKYPVLCQFVKKIRIHDEKFLTLKEAKKLYCIFKIFNLKWNMGDYKLVCVHNVIKQKNYVYMFNFLIKYIKESNKKMCNEILAIFINEDKMKIEYKHMFQLIFNIINSINDQTHELVCEFYGINKLPDFKSLKSDILKMNKTLC